MKKTGWNGCKIKKKVFSVRSLSLECRSGRDLVPYKFLWKTKTPRKNKVFDWLVLNNKVLSKVNLRARDWEGPPSCSCCGLLETTNHIFFECPVSCLLCLDRRVLCRTR